MDYIKIPHSLYKSMVLLEKELKEETHQQGLEILKLERTIEEIKNATADSSDAE